MQLLRNATMLSERAVLTSAGQGSTIKICFAVLPGSKNVRIYMPEGNGAMQVKNGVACANVARTASFLLGSK